MHQLISWDPSGGGLVLERDRAIYQISIQVRQGEKDRVKRKRVGNAVLAWSTVLEPQNYIRRPKPGSLTDERVQFGNAIDSTGSFRHEFPIALGFQPLDQPRLSRRTLHRGHQSPSVS